MISRQAKSSIINEKDNLDSILVKFAILHGKLVEVIKEAQDPSSDLGKDISDVEKREIFESIKSIEDKILKIKIAIDKNI